MASDGSIWGVRCEGVVQMMPSADAAFRCERDLRVLSSHVQVVVWTEGVWVPVSSASFLRADPEPPGPRPVRWWQDWTRKARQRVRFAAWRGRHRP